MKNKGRIVLLLLLTVFVWGYLLRRIMLGTSDTSLQSNTVKVSRQILPSEIETTAEDKRLLLNYKDPFLTTSPSNQPVQFKKEQPKPTVVQNWPAIKVIGFIGSNPNKVAILQVGQQEVLIKKGETINDITLEKFYNDSLLVSFRGQKKIIKQP